MDERKKRARQRALRAAQVVTIAFALGTGCSSNDGPGDSGMGMDSAMADSSMMMDSGTDSALPDTGVDSGFDAGEDAGFDAGAEDAGFDAGIDAAVADAGFDAAACAPPHTTRECCEADPFGFWDEERGVCIMAVPGPFVPPAMA